MNWRSPRLTCLALAFYGGWRLFPYLLDHHALRAESPYFLPACVACAAAPLVMAIIYGSYHVLLRRLRESDRQDEDEISDPLRRGRDE
jgi:hypothetical protein